MYRGISLPVRCLNGRVVLEEGDKENAKIISLCLADGDTNNPFLTVGIPHPIFSLMSGGAAALIQREVERHFTRLETATRAKLESVKFLETAEAEFTVEVEYVDLETDAPKQLTKNLGGQG